MAITDEIKEQKKKIADMTWKEKLGYFWEYYRIHTFVGISIFLLLFFFVKDLLTNNQDTVFQVAIVNSEAQYLDENSERAFGEYLGIDPQKEKVIFDNSYQLHLDSMDQSTVASSQKMVANAQLEILDVIIAPSDVIDYYGENMFLGDLTTMLPPETFKELEEAGRIIYAKDEAGTEYPAGIDIADSPWVEKTGLYLQQKPILGCVENSVQEENIQKFLEYIYMEQ